MAKLTQADIASIAEALMPALRDVVRAEVASAAPTPDTTPKASKTATKAQRKAKADRKARKDANVAAGRMSTARYGCEGMASDGGPCKFGSYNKAPADVHTLKDGHKAVELA